MTLKEQLMYEIISRLSKIDAPLNFKGALITNLIFKEKGYTDIQRMTKDIDANWVGKPPKMETLKDVLNTSIKSISNNFEVIIKRNYENGKSAGFIVKDVITEDKIVSIDVDIKPLSKGKTYYYGEVGINGVLPDEIIADKISSVSSDAVFKHRTKDIIDLYALTHCVDIKIQNIYDYCKTNDRNIYDFSAFVKNKDQIEYAYNKLKGVANKPSFNDVYYHLEYFLMPFICNTSKILLWNSSNQLWIDTEHIANITAQATNSVELELDDEPEL